MVQRTIALVFTLFGLFGTATGHAEPPPPETHRDKVYIELQEQQTGVVILSTVQNPQQPQPLELTLPPGHYILHLSDAAGSRLEHVDLTAVPEYDWSALGLQLTRNTALGRLDLDPKVVRSPPPTSFSYEDPTAIARAELVGFQTAHGIALGIELCVLVNCEDGRAFVASMGLGGATGFGLAFGLSGGGIRPGQALLLDSAVIWGGWTGAAALAASDPNEQTVGGVLLGSQLAGLGVGLGLLKTWAPHAGQVAMANSLALWAGGLTAMGFAASDFSGSDRIFWLSLLGAADAGIIAGALLSESFEMSRSRVLLIDIGGILGGLTGMGIGMLAGGNDVNEAVFIPGMVGSVAGLGLGTYLTRHWDGPELPGSVGLWPTREGIELTWSGQF